MADRYTMHHRRVIIILYDFKRLKKIMIKHVNISKTFKTTNIDNVIYILDTVTSKTTLKNYCKFVIP